MGDYIAKAVQRIIAQHKDAVGAVALKLHETGYDVHLREHSPLSEGGWFMKTEVWDAVLGALFVVRTRKRESATGIRFDTDVESVDSGNRND